MNRSQKKSNKTSTNFQNFCTIPLRRSDDFAVQTPSSLLMNKNACNDMRQTTPETSTDVIIEDNMNLDLHRTRCVLPFGNGNTKTKRQQSNIENSMHLLSKLNVQDVEMDTGIVASRFSENRKHISSSPPVIVGPSPVTKRSRQFVPKKLTRASPLNLNSVVRSKPPSPSPPQRQRSIIRAPVRGQKRPNNEILSSSADDSSQSQTQSQQQMMTQSQSQIDCTPVGCSIPERTSSDLKLELEMKRHEQQNPDTSQDEAEPILCMGNPYLTGDLKCPETVNDAKRRKIATATSKFERDFIILDNASHGSYGRVLKCRKRFDSCVYAIKRLKQQIGRSDKKLMDNCLQEVYKLAACNSPHIIRYYDAWLEDKCLSIQTEWCERGSLSDQMNNNNVIFNESKLTRVVHHMALALLHIHSKHIVHYDVKPDNIVEASDGTYKLCDFGLYRASGDRRYLPREALDEVVDPNYRDRVDIYSLGASLVHLAVGPSFTGIKNTMVPQFFSKAFKFMLNSMLQEDPNGRPTAESLVAFVVEHFAKT